MPLSNASEDSLTVNDAEQHMDEEYRANYTGLWNIILMAQDYTSSPF